MIIAEMFLCPNCKRIKVILVNGAFIESRFICDCDGFEMERKYFTDKDVFQHFGIRNKTKGDPNELR